MYTVLVCGGRNYKDRDKVFAALDELVDERHLSDPEDGAIRLRVVSGAARGADAFAIGWARQEGADFKEYPAQWDDIEAKGALVRTRQDGKRYNVLAGRWRNRQMLNEEKIDLVLAFPGGTGTADMVEIARDAGIEVREIDA